MNIPVFVISLKGSSERRRRLDEHFNKMGIAFEWYDAIYGKELSEKEIEASCNMEAVNRAPNWLTRSAIGCALSHINIYKEIIRRQAPYAIIFEDDVVINKDFQKHIEALLPQLKKNEIISLFYQSWYPLELVKESATEFDKNYKLYEVADMVQPISAAAYLVTLDACKTLIASIVPISYTADSWGEFKKNAAFDSFRCVYPRLVDVVDAKSTIQYLEDDWKGKLMKWIDNNKVFPVYQYLRYKRKKSRQKMMGVKIVDKKTNTSHA